MCHIFCGASGIRHNVKRLSSEVVNDEVILNPAILVGEKCQRSGPWLELSNIGNNELLNKLNAFLAMNSRMNQAF